MYFQVNRVRQKSLFTNFKPSGGRPLLETCPYVLSLGGRNNVFQWPWRQDLKMTGLCNDAVGSQRQHAVNALPSLPLSVAAQRGGEPPTERRRARLGIVTGLWERRVNTNWSCQGWREYHFQESRDKTNLVQVTTQKSRHPRRRRAFKFGRRSLKMGTSSWPNLLFRTWIKFRHGWLGRLRIQTISWSPGRPLVTRTVNNPAPACQVSRERLRRLSERAESLSPL